MILIADSGSTKTDWCLIRADKSLYQFKTEGLNPYWVKPELITQLLQKKLQYEHAESVEKVYFYGSGCTPGEKCQLVADALAAVCTNASIEVDSDLLGAAKATFGNEKGMVCILGTGSNTGIYNGTGIETQIPSLGYLLGDEGGGAYIGRRLLGLFLRNQLPINLSASLKKYFEKMEIDNPAQQIYKEKYPNRWLAALLSCFETEKDDLFLKKVVRECIVDLFQHVIIHYPDCKKYRLSAVGSVAFYFKEELAAVCDRFGIELSMALKSPIDQLVIYHVSEKV